MGTRKRSILLFFAGAEAATIAEEKACDTGQYLRRSHSQIGQPSARRKLYHPDSQIIWM
jgi:hypothetical protein